MTTALQLRRGTTAQHSTFTGAVGEVTVDTTKKTAVVHDGTTVGGHPLAKEGDLTKFVRHDTASQDLTASQQANARTNIGLGNVNNTSDADKPISTATKAALDQKLNISGGTLTGPLTLAGNATQPLHAVTKQQLDGALTELDASAVTTGVFAPERLGSGTPDNTKFLRGDGTWQTISLSPTTAQVLSATAGASVGAVGTYAFLNGRDGRYASFTAGSTYAGSSLRYAGLSAGIYEYGSQGPMYWSTGATPAGTWRAMGTAIPFHDSNAYSHITGTLFLRIS